MLANLYAINKCSKQIPNDLIISIFLITFQNGNNTYHFEIVLVISLLKTLMYVINQKVSASEVTANQLLLPKSPILCNGQT
jgi:hypothetical protein